jgi:hypothetical protein
MEKNLIDNFIDEKSFKKIQQLFWSQEFPWFYSDCVNYSGDEHYQFTHLFYHHNLPMSSFFSALEPILIQLNLQGGLFSLVKIKANLLTKDIKNTEHGFHVDFDNLESHHKIKTAILYMNSNNGYTKFEDGTIINSIENRMVIFDSKLKHTGSTCTDENSRVVINFNYF